MPKRPPSDSDPCRDVFDRLLTGFEGETLLADLFHILHFDEHEEPTQSATNLTLLVPQCIHELLTDDSDAATPLIEKLILWGRPETRALSPHALAQLADSIRSRYAAFRDLGHLLSIADEQDREARAVLEQVLSPRWERSGLIKGLRQRIRTALTTTLSFAKRTGTAILMRGRDLIEFLGDRIAHVEFPSKLDALVEAKTKFTARAFAFRGGKTAKFFIGVVSAAGGLFSTNPGLAYGGLLLALGDP